MVNKVEYNYTEINKVCQLMYLRYNETTLLLRTYPNCVFPVAILVFDRPLAETTRSLEHI